MGTSGRDIEITCNYKYFGTKIHTKFVREKKTVNVNHFALL